MDLEREEDKKRGRLLGRGGEKKKSVKPCTRWRPTRRAYLLRVLKLPPETFIHPLGGLLRATHHGLDVYFKAAVQQLVDLAVVIIIIPADDKKKVRVSLC